MDAVEVGAKNVDEALRRALEELGVERDAVEVEVLSEGRPGLLGLGFEEARVRVTLRADREAARAEPARGLGPSSGEPSGGEPVEPGWLAPSAGSGGPPLAPPWQGGARGTPGERPVQRESEGAEGEVEQISEPPAAAVGTEEAEDAAEEILQAILDRLGVEAHIVHQPALAGETMLPAPQALLDIKGQNLSVLIGRRGETLSALQYLVNLLASRRLKTRVTVAIDVDSYRQRRALLLQGLAQRMADRVRATGQPMTLEPMPAHERRLVHLALANQDDVMTQSLGEGEHRKVTISLRRGLAPPAGA